MFVDGKFVESKATEWIDLHDPATNEVVTRIPKCTQAEMENAVESSKKAYKTWSQTSVLTRQQVMFKLQQIIRANMGLLAHNITKEQGKTLIDAEGDVLRGLRTSHSYTLLMWWRRNLNLLYIIFSEVVEHMCSITSLQLGEIATNVAKDMDTYSLTLPLGVTAGITPFNFPAMIPLWMFPVAITCGNTSIIKPSERDPGATMLLMDMLNEAGCPPGVVNVRRHYRL